MAVRLSSGVGWCPQGALPHGAERALLLAGWTFGDGSSWISLGDGECVLLGARVTSVSAITATSFMGPSGQHEGGQMQANTSWPGGFVPWAAHCFFQQGCSPVAVRGPSQPCIHPHAFTPDPWSSSSLCLSSRPLIAGVCVYLLVPNHFPCPIKWSPGGFAPDHHLSFRTTPDTTAAIVCSRYPRTKPAHGWK